ncbi:MAG: hypothetical protein QJT81_06120 [Candidatus Thiothrix putei]|uniref:Chromosome condensation regulator RCC1 n=1 Tax=Candidatus Thiothrix putei TaxID=3080811 RepID=A0AA95HG34_9GAMM|nr:MAG: hypothetical protein QJT81_06120 [Candidatus Thiothrix putei]
MKQPLPSQQSESRRVSLWHSLLFLFTTVLFPVLAFAQAPNLVLQPATADFGFIGKGGDSALTARVLNYNPMPATVSAGYLHSCAVAADGTVKCWGLNNYNQLGDGTTTQRSTANPVADITTAKQVASGAYHSCALLADRSVQCWGNNANGELGDGTTTQRSKPVSVSGINNATAISVGERFSCALLADETVKCWGRNPSGQLGDGTTTQRITPVSVQGLTDVLSLSVGSDHACAVTRDNGAVKCWGQNAYGQLGNGTKTNSNVPVVVSGLSNAIAVSAGQLRSCAIELGGSAKCWGNNEHGAIGDSTSTERLTPTQVTGLTSGVTVIDTGRRHTCAVVNGGAKCWGYNAYGVVGDGTTTGRNAPVDVSGLTSGISDIDVESFADASHTCATTTAGGIKCWGYNDYNQLGDGTATQRTAPVE